MARPKRCSTCGLPVKGHKGVHGANCSAGREDEQAAQQTTVEGIPPNFNSLSIDQLREFAVNSQRTINAMGANSANQTSTRDSSTPSGEEAQALAARLQEANRSTVSDQRQPIGGVTPVSQLRGDPALGDAADQFLSQVFQRAPWLFPAQDQRIPSHQPPHPGLNLGAQGATSGPGLTNPSTQTPENDFPRSQGTYFNPGFNRNQPGLSLFDVNNINSGMSRKDYKESLICNFLCNQTVEYSKLALGRTDLDANQINLPTFAIGFAHFLIHSIKNNKLVDKDELIARLFHFKNMMEITFNNTTNTDFNSRGWQLARAYDAKVCRDMDLGLLDFKAMGSKLQYDCHLHALAQVPHLVTHQNAPNNGKPQGNKQICGDYNKNPNEGNHCKWSAANPGKVCNRTHSCWFCFNKNNAYRAHREIDCQQRIKLAAAGGEQSASNTTNPFLGGAGNATGQ